MARQRFINAVNRGAVGQSHSSQTQPVSFRKSTSPGRGTPVLPMQGKPISNIPSRGRLSPVKNSPSKLYIKSKGITISAKRKKEAASPAAQPKNAYLVPEEKGIKRFEIDLPGSTQLNSSKESNKSNKSIRSIKQEKSEYIPVLVQKNQAVLPRRLS